MNCKKVEDLLPLYLENELEPKKLEIIAKHLQGCKNCSALLEDFKRIGGLLEKYGKRELSPLPADFYERLNSKLDQIPFKKPFFVRFPVFQPRIWAPAFGVLAVVGIGYFLLKGSSSPLANYSADGSAPRGRSYVSDNIAENGSPSPRPSPIKGEGGQKITEARDDKQDVIAKNEMNTRSHARGRSADPCGGQTQSVSKNEIATPRLEKIVEVRNDTNRKQVEALRSTQGDNTQKPQVVKRTIEIAKVNPEENEEIIFRGPQKSIRKVFVDQWKGTASGIKENRAVFIEDQKGWEELWGAHTKNLNPKPAMPQINFNKNKVVAVFVGEKDTAAYDFRIANIDESMTTLYVDIEEAVPNAGEPAAKELISPYHIVLLKK